VLDPPSPKLLAFFLVPCVSVYADMFVPPSVCRQYFGLSHFLSSRLSHSIGSHCGLRVWPPPQLVSSDKSPLFLCFHLDIILRWGIGRECNIRLAFFALSSRSCGINFSILTRVPPPIRSFFASLLAHPLLILRCCCSLTSSAHNPPQRTCPARKLGLTP